MLCSKQGLAFDQAHSKWIGCRGGIESGELNARGASFVVNNMGFADQSHDGPPNCCQIRILALAIKSRLPPLWFALTPDERFSQLVASTG